MQRLLVVMALLVLGGAACATVEKAPTDTRLVEAQKAFDEGIQLHEAERYTEAVKQAERALELREAVLGGSHPEVASCLNLLGVSHSLQGNHGRAEPLLLRALAIREAALGNSHPDVVKSLNSLAMLYMEQGSQSQAEPLLKRVLAIREATLGKSHPHVALVLNNLANTYFAQGLYARAEPLHERALAIREATLGNNHPSVADSLNNLAILYATQGLNARAGPLFERALAIYEAALSEHHPHMVLLLTNLANFYRDQGLYARAELLYERALAIGETALGKSHPEVAKPLDNLAILYMEQGLYARAGPLHERALAIREAAFGKNHPDVAYSLNSLALLRLAQQNLGEAVAFFTRASAASEAYLRQEVFSFSEARLASFLQLLRRDEEILYSLVRSHPEDARVRHLALSTTLLREGRSVEEIADASRIIFRTLGQADREAFERLRALRIQVSALSLAGPGARSPAEHQRHIEELAVNANALEEDLSRRSALLHARSSLPPLEEITDRVAKALPKDGALIVFITYHDSPLVPHLESPPSQRHIRSELRCLALLLFADGRTHALDLGPAEPINSAALRLHDALASRAASYQPAAQELYTLVFRHLTPLLGNVQQLFLVPDGQLALVPFAALHDGERFLIDTWDFTYLSSGKHLLRRTEDTPATQSVVVLANPDFGSAPEEPALAAVAAPDSLERLVSLERFFSTPRSELADHPWPLLPGTQDEAEAIQRLFPQARLLLGPKATKEALLKLTSPGVLHIATHGFFLEDASAAQDTRGVKHFGAMGDAGPVQRPPDPLLRSGLVLAGASSPEAHGAKVNPHKESLVTALELAGMNLWGTQLVVLSACDTGRGDVRVGQGVYGLRRALVVAGAETVVTSLWKVNDETTQALMESYYRHLLAGDGRVTALREAMKELRQKKPHPYFWAPFIAIGQDGPLKGLIPDTAAPAAP